GNLLLVLGFSLLLGKPGPIDRVSSFVSLGLVLAAIALFLIPAAGGFDGRPDRHTLQVLSLPVAGVLLVLYVGAQWFQLRRHRGLHHGTAEAGWSMRASLV